MGRVELSSGLERAAARLVRDRVDRITEQVQREAQRTAPDAKTWISEKDDRVRPAHVDAHGQTIPDNLHYQLTRMVYIPRGRGRDGKAINPAGGWTRSSGFDLAWEPRDPELPDEQKINCRCASVPLPGAIARRVTTRTARIQGMQVVAQVVVRFPRIGEAEFGNSVDTGTRFLGRAGVVVAARLR